MRKTYQLELHRNLSRFLLIEFLGAPYHATILTKQLCDQSLKQIAQAF